MSGARLGVSNLAWAAEHEAAALDLLAASGAQGVEVAPTRLAPWDGLTAGRLAAFRSACADRGLVVSSLQAIFYDVPGAALLADAAAFTVMAEHMRRVADVAHGLGATVAVFGAPRCRLRGELPADAAMARAVERMGALGDIAAAGGLRLGVEAVPAYYGCDFLTRPSEVVALVGRCSHSSIRAHVDIACATLAGCDPADAVRASDPVHYHIAEPDLTPLRAPTCDHAGAAAALAGIGYDGWMVIEMREDAADDLAAIRDSIAFARRIYGERMAA